MVANPAVRWTIHDLAAMPDDGGWKRYEIIDGELLVTRAPHIRHQGAASNLNGYLWRWSQETGLGNVYQAPGLVFGEGDAVIPDLVWASKACQENGIDESGHFNIAPELVVEILSAGQKNEQRDKQVKLKLYSIHGVQEYWILNWRLKTIDIYRREAAVLQKVATLTVQDTLTSPLFSGFSCSVKGIFT